MALLLMLWPALDLYFVIEGRPAVIRSRRPALLLALILLILPLAMLLRQFGVEQGVFYSLLAIMATAGIFVLLRVWQPALTRLISWLALVASIAGVIYGFF
tara:strand:+ start:87815 stop:88117 length:303 start_codon:yes stop_codon:yes gene_type:complete